MAAKEIDLDQAYHAQYQLDSVAPANLAAFDAVADALCEMFAPRASMDIGCGGGALVRALLERGVNAWGIDGASSAVELTPQRLFCFDLRDRLVGTDNPIGMLRVDLVTCFDTAEHIEPEFAAIFAQTVAHFVSMGGWLVLGPAGPRQEGHYHVNLQHPCYWIALMESYGLTLSAGLSETLRARIREDERHAHAWWVSENLMVFGCFSP